MDSYASPGGARTPGGRRSRYRSDARDVMGGSRVGSYGSVADSELAWGGRSPTDKWLEEHEEVQQIFRHTTHNFIDVAGRTPVLDGQDLDERIRMYRDAPLAAKPASWDGHPLLKLPDAADKSVQSAGEAMKAARRRQAGARRDAAAVASALGAIRPVNVGELVVPVDEL